MQTVFNAHGVSVDISEHLPANLHFEFEQLSPRMRYLADYGWKQSCSDSFASAKDAAEFEGKLNARVDKILTGKMVVRDGVTRTTDPVEKEIKRIVEENFSKWMRQRKAQGKKKASPELQEMWLDQFHEKRGEETRSQAEAIVEARAVLEVDFSDIELPE